MNEVCEHDTNHLEQFLRGLVVDKTGNVNINKCRHQILTVKTVHYSSMTRDHISKVLGN